MKRLLSGLALAVGCVAAQARPQLSDAEAARHQVADYLAQGPAPWQPAVLTDSRHWRADFTVALDGSGTHRSVQAALDALPPRGPEAKRVFIHVKPGVYREIVCVRDKAPFTLYGDAADASAVVITEGRYNATRKRVGDPANPCDPNLAAATMGTAGSASVALFSDDIQLAHLTIANDAMDRVRQGQGYPGDVAESGGAQAVALMTQGDRLQLDHVRLLGHQDTFYARAAPGAAGRVLVRASLIAGDVDFIFGNATLVIDASTIVSRAGRRTIGNGGHVLAPSTAASTRLGFLVTGSRFVAEDGVAADSISIGRAWDHSVARGTWQPGVSPNGQALVRDSLLGPHLAGWGASTSRRPFSAEGESANRFFEYRNKPLAARDLGREVLAASDGWAAADGGTRGGADARAEHVFDVRNRAELVAALAVGSAPKIVKIRKRIDLSVDDAGRSLGYDDYRDPAFDVDAFVRAYDPATWGKKAPAGPLEDARDRSAKSQAEHVMIKVPPNTTLVGVGVDAGFVNGGLFLGKVDNVIVRNLHFADAYDYFPVWDPNDNASGEWNSEYDNLSLRGATHVWIDHCSFDDGLRPDQAERIALGRRMQHHDGLLDITKQSNFVTVSWSHFRDHDKTNLIGSGDNQQLDAGKLKVTFHHNLWERVMARTPRVRYGEVHLYNNLFVGRGDVAYAFEYSIGVGAQSHIYSERNVWETTPDIGATRLAKLWKGSAFFDQGSLHNGQPVDLLGALRAANPGATIAADVGWAPTLTGPMDEASAVAARVRAGAGAERL